MFYSERLPHATTSAAAARRVVERLADEVDAATLANLRLLVSELIANAVEHTAPERDIELEVTLADGRVRVEVVNAGAGFTYRPRRPGDSLGSGWGLHFVSEIAEDWGSDVTTGSRVWFELPIGVPARRT